MTGSIIQQHIEDKTMTYANGYMPTPWGMGKITEHYSEDLDFVSTPSHGGFKVGQSLLKAIPIEWRQASFNRQGIRGWFEEDCDWCMVALSFPGFFSPDQLKAAQHTFDHWIAPKLV